MSAASILQRYIPFKNPNLPANPKTLINKITSFLDSNLLHEAVTLLFSSPNPLPHSIYARLLQLCTSHFAVDEARKVGSHLFSFSTNPPVFLLNRVIETFGVCGCLEDAEKLFDQMPQKNGGSWNSMIKVYNLCGEQAKVLPLFIGMMRDGVLGNGVTFSGVVNACGGVLRCLELVQVHGVIVKLGFCSNAVVGCSIVDAYGKCGVMVEAKRMFDEIDYPNDVTWNVIVRRFVEAGDGKEAVVMFLKMLRMGVRPLSFTVSNALVACSSIQALEEGMQIHGVVVKRGYVEFEAVMNSLLDMYVKCEEMEDGRKVFDQCGSRDLILWSSIVSAYAMGGRMREAEKLFNEMPERNVVSWNAMIGGYINSHHLEEALDFIHLMWSKIDEFDHTTLALMLNVCAGLSDVGMGKQVHAFTCRHGFHDDTFVGNAILDMYGKCGSFRTAKVWFDQMSPLRDDVSWSILLTCYARHGMSEQAMAFFREMQSETKPSTYTFATLLAACANTFALDQGKQIHCFFIKNYLEIDIIARGALVDMYSKCRCLRYGLIVFREAASRDLILWNSIMLGSCHNGMGRGVLNLFQLMEEEGVKPDHITFQGLLYACVNEGCVDLAIQYFSSMSDKYCIIPRLEHYECMVELFSRYGCMKELKKFIKSMPFDLTIPMLTRVYDASREHGYSKLGKWAADRLNQLNPTVSSESNSIAQEH